MAPHLLDGKTDLGIPLCPILVSTTLLNRLRLVSLGENHKTPQVGSPLGVVCSQEAPLPNSAGHGGARSLHPKPCNNLREPLFKNNLALTKPPINLALGGRIPGSNRPRSLHNLPRPLNNLLNNHLCLPNSLHNNHSPRLCPRPSKILRQASLKTELPMEPQPLNPWAMGRTIRTLLPIKQPEEPFRLNRASKKPSL